MATLGGDIDTSLWEAVQARFPDATLGSAYRPGDPGFHGKAAAIDVGGPSMQAVADWAVTQDVAQVIWGPGPLKYNVGGTNITDPNQLRNQVYADDLPDHYDHVHIAAEHPLVAGAGGGFSLPGGATQHPDTLAQNASTSGDIKAIYDSMKQASKFFNLLVSGAGWSRYLKVVCGCILILAGSWFVMQSVLFPNESPFETIKDIATGDALKQFSEIGTGDAPDPVGDAASKVVPSK